MKIVTLLRHAKTEPDSPTGRDIDRALTDRGRADAARIGKEFRDLGLSPGVVLASPAKRVVETLEGIGGISATWDERIYNATAGELIAIIREVADGSEHLMLVGHNPGFEEVASILAGKRIGMSAGALAEIELSIDHWRDAGGGRGRLVRLIDPKEMD